MESLLFLSLGPFHLENLFMAIKFFNFQKGSFVALHSLTELISFLFVKRLRVCFLLKGSSKTFSLICEQILHRNTLLL